ncbi:MAG: hypothetical protein M3Z21_01415 [Pseudomonadota bacterium]|nr:hypothetical protein [Pseudomonadota bacterium]
MLTLQECLEYCELTEDEIHAIAEHEHVPEIVAAELGSCLLETDEGVCLIRRYMLDDIRQAVSRGMISKAQLLHEVLAHFDETHPINAG